MHLDLFMLFYYIVITDMFQPLVAISGWREQDYKYNCNTVKSLLC